MQLMDRIDVEPGPPPLRLVTTVTATLPRQVTTGALRHRDPRPTAESFARGVAEVLARARPAEQLRDLATFEVVRTVERAIGRRSHHTGRSVPRLRSVRLGAPCPDVAEACAVIDGGARSWALAYRLEQHRGRWRCTVLQLG
jgi:hypothetical protein